MENKRELSERISNEIKVIIKELMTEEFTNIDIANFINTDNETTICQVTYHREFVTNDLILQAKTRLINK